MGKSINEMETYTYADLKKLDSAEGEHWELVNGTPYLQARPSYRHQEIAGNLFFVFKQYLKGKKCTVHQESEVNLSPAKEEDEIITLVVPDLFITCHPEKIDGQKFNGVPELIIEILSKDYRKDRWRNFNLYRDAGVKEYWIVDQYRNSVDVFVLRDGEFKLHGYYGLGEGEENIIRVNILEDLEVHVSDIFAQ
ncbi:Uma2 family endonuclease [Croceifilum oryzae]|uniref:Uma2 family endonuclease n=1 Tax=Croceifilum oryzae TaxID=1553429 RepID=A0AAJ1WSD2_9BACL|nr:Uma2 family endonuclease [Croceifilum oryzae]MDQ0417580.1 Uma2 family endonuclease [Croceifilum oryzae]